VGEKYFIRICRHCQADFGGHDKSQVESERDSHEASCSANSND